MVDTSCSSRDMLIAGLFCHIECLLVCNDFCHPGLTKVNMRTTLDDIMSHAVTLLLHQS